VLGNDSTDMLTPQADMERITEPRKITDLPRTLDASTAHRLTAVLLHTSDTTLHAPRLPCPCHRLPGSPKPRAHPPASPPATSGGALPPNPTRFRGGAGRRGGNGVQEGEGSGKSVSRLATAKGLKPREEFIRFNAPLRFRSLL
jgi:hypothetical protein